MKDVCSDYKLLVMDERKKEVWSLMTTSLFLREVGERQCNELVLFMVKNRGGNGGKCFGTHVLA